MNARHPSRPARAAVAWAAAAASCPFAGDEVHVWWAPLGVDAATLARLAAHLSPAERQRAARLRIERHRRDFIAGRGLLRELLGGYLDRPPASIRFQLGPVGKPALVPDGHDGTLCFNYSDSGRAALYAFAWAREVGVDLEHLPRKVEYERIARRKFTVREADAILAAPAPVRRDAFLACWTRKEGYGKAKGVGIQYPLDSVELCVDCAQPSLRIPDPELEPNPGFWTLHQIYPSDEYVATVVHAGQAGPLRYFGWLPNGG